MTSPERPRVPSQAAFASSCASFACDNRHSMMCVAITIASAVFLG